MAIKRKKASKVTELKSRINEIEPELIRNKAYGIYKETGCEDATANWLQAEHELKTI